MKAQDQRDLIARLWSVLLSQDDSWLDDHRPSD
jgi:hypothetical protein